MSMKVLDYYKFNRIRNDISLTEYEMIWLIEIHSRLIDILFELEFTETKKYKSMNTYTSVYFY